MTILLGSLIPAILVTVAWLGTVKIKDWKQRGFYRALIVLLAWPAVLVTDVGDRIVVTNGWLLLFSNNAGLELQQSIPGVLFLAFGLIWSVIIIPTKFERPQQISISTVIGLLFSLVYGLLINQPVGSARMSEALEQTKLPMKKVIEPLKHPGEQAMTPLKMLVIQSVPAVILGDEVLQSHIDGKLSIKGFPGAMPTNLVAVLINQRTGDQYNIIPDDSGGFEMEISVQTGDRILAAWIPVEDNVATQAVKTGQRERDQGSQHR